jgi:hypothetical protein
MATTDVPMLRQSKSAHQTSPTSRDLTRLQPRGALPAAGEFPAATPTLRFMPGGIDLVARERERSALRDAIVTAVGGHGGILLVAASASQR